jgi:hypothetical protein
MKIPNNIIKSQYTSGNEFVYLSTNLPYQGYYYKLNGSFFQGKEFSPSSSKIIKKQDTNTLLDNPHTATFSKVSGITSQQLQSPVFSSIQSSSNTLNTRFFAKQTNVQPISIKEITESTFRSLLSKPSPFYQVIFVGSFNGSTIRLEQADQQMPGLKSFVLG